MLSFSSRLGNRLRKAATSSDVGSLMQAKLHLRPSHKHFSGLVSSACAVPVARNSAAIVVSSSFFIERSFHLLAAFAIECDCPVRKLFHLDADRVDLNAPPNLNP